MCTMSVLCPLCTQASFSSIDALRACLIKAANGPLPCPICHESFLGLDKLTIHLFSHTNLMNNMQASLPLPQHPPTATTTITTSAIPKSKAKCIANKANGMALPADGAELLVAAASLAPTTPTTTTHSKKISTPEAAVNRERCGKKSKQAQSKERTQCQHTNAATMHGAAAATAAAITTTTPPNATTYTVATCEVCELTFRNAQLRDMHFRLVHQNIIGLTELNAIAAKQQEQQQQQHQQQQQQQSSTISMPMVKCQTAEHEFKCHLCAKTFKMKGSLRVHLKVVHLMGLPHEDSGNSCGSGIKQNICERIRQRTVNADGNTIAPPPPPRPQPQPPPLQSVAPTLATVMPSGTTFSIGTLTLLPGTNGSGVSCGGVANIGVPSTGAGAGADGVFNINTNDGTNSNLLLVFNATNVAAAPTAPPDYPIKRETAAALNNDTNPKIWECDVCTKAFTTKYFLKKHKRLHTGEMPYTCELCGRTFTFQQSYHKHLLYHNDEKPHVCTICSRAFKELSTLHNHERIHSGEKPFKCEVCGKSFRQRVSFLVHTRIHTGIMPYKCELCQKSFRYKVSQRTHKCVTKSTTPEGGEPVDAIAAAASPDQMSDSFIKAFLESSAIAQMCNSAQQSPASHEIANITTHNPIDEHEALLSKSIDDIVVESCQKMGIGNTTIHALEHHQHHQQQLNGYAIADGSNSPSEKLQNMRLCSPQQLIDTANSIEASNGSNEFPHFLLDDVNANMHYENS